MEITVQLRCSINRNSKLFYQSPTDTRWINMTSSLFISVPSRAFLQIVWKTLGSRWNRCLSPSSLPTFVNQGDRWKFAPAPCNAYQRRKIRALLLEVWCFSARSRRPRVYEAVAGNAGRTRCASLSGVYITYISSRREQRRVAIFIR